MTGLFPPTTGYRPPFFGWPAPQSAAVGKTLVLGEDGTAFATDQTQVLAFDLATGVVRWSWQPTQGPVEMIMATAGNSLVAKNRDDNTGLETVVRLDSLGQATYETWTNPSIQHAVGDLWLGQGSLAAISASEVEWPDSVWPESDNNKIRSSEQIIDVNVFTVLEANISDQIIRDRVKRGTEYWQRHAGILLHWDHSITGVPACPLSDPTCPVDSTQNILVIQDRNDAKLQYIAQMFPIRQGIFMVFTQSTGESSKAITLGIPRDTIEFLNVILFNYENVPIESHELGHVFQLQHRPLQFLNLMCGRVGIPIIDDFTFCSPSVAIYIAPDQIDDARRAAPKLY